MLVFLGRPVVERPKGNRVDAGLRYQALVEEISIAAHKRRWQSFGNRIRGVWGSAFSHPAPGGCFGGGQHLRMKSGKRTAPGRSIFFLFRNNPRRRSCRVAFTNHVFRGRSATSAMLATATFSVAAVCPHGAGLTSGEGTAMLSGVGG